MAKSHLSGSKNRNLMSTYYSLAVLTSSLSSPIAASLFCYCRIIFLLLPHHFFFSSTLKAQKFSCYPTVTNPTAKGDNDINRRLYILTIRVICSQKDHQKENDIGEERFLQKLLFTTRYTCFHSFQPFFSVQTAMKRSPHPAGRALRTQRKFVALAWSRVTLHPPPLRYALRGNIYCQYGSYLPRTLGLAWLLLIRTPPHAPVPVLPTTVNSTSISMFVAMKESDIKRGEHGNLKSVWVAERGPELLTTSQV